MRGYSLRKTACGSSLVARRAGKYEATAAISAKIAGIAKNVAVSSGVISNSRLLRYPVRLAATATPSTRPMAVRICLLYTSDAADERSSVDLGGRRIIK